MERRAFLSLCTTAVAATALGRYARWWPAWDRTWSLEGKALFPGAPLRVTVAASAPAGTRLRAEVRADRAVFRGGDYPATPGATVIVETPYPHHDLVPGTYHVRLVLEAADGRVIDACDAGGYCLHAFRFSA